MNKRASILLVSIWILVIFSIYSLALYRLVTPQIMVARRVYALTLSRAAAESLVAYVRAQRLENLGDYDSLYQLSKIREGDIGLAHYVYYLGNEEARLNLNKAAPEAISNIFGSDSCGKAINESSLKPFSVNEEILMVEGVTPELFSRVEDAVTVCGNGKININTASVRVLAGLGISPEVANALLGYRLGPDQQEATEGDGIFKSAEEVINYVCASISGTLDGNRIAELFSRGVLDVNSETLRLRATIKVLNTAMEYDIIFNNSGILQWRER